MVVVADSYMGMFLPMDISNRITKFIADDSLEFPFINKDEIMATFYLFGKDSGVNGETEILVATDLAKRTIEQTTRDVRVYHAMPNTIRPDFIRQNYIRRALQISIELQNTPLVDLSETNKRVANDPSILSICFAQHIAYYKQDYFFELFQPFKEMELHQSLRKKLQGRMLLLGFNVKDSRSLPFESTLTPFISWLIKTSK
jgi:hypothetical protein